MKVANRGQVKLLLHHFAALIAVRKPAAGRSCGCPGSPSPVRPDTRRKNRIVFLEQQPFLVEVVPQSAFHARRQLRGSCPRTWRWPCVALYSPRCNSLSSVSEIFAPPQPLRSLRFQKRMFLLRHGSRNLPRSAERDFWRLAGMGKPLICLFCQQEFLPIFFEFMQRMPIVGSMSGSDIRNGQVFD